MARQKQNRGTCAFCGKDYTRGGMKKHLAACDDRKKAIQEADASKRKSQPLYHLIVYDAYNKSNYWLHLEMNGLAALEELDQYLRAIWLECCGHMSTFFAGKKAYRDPELEMDHAARDVFNETARLLHIYDFGTSSETMVEVADVREGRPLTKHPIALMARNHPPEYPCMECGKPARHFCMECQIEDDASGLLCDKHVKDHPHEDYGPPTPIVNSPRVGMCGYSGPAEPPY
jgi:hypothetical protein